MDYIILSAEYYVDLSQKVRDYISHGWTPQGGVSVVLESGGTSYSQKRLYQAMIKTK